MSVTFRPASKAQAKPLIGLYSESGCGKTYSALLLAKGFAGDMSKVAMIETESGRGEAFATDPVVGGYLVHSIRDEFSPQSYGEAIVSAGQAGLSALIIDSASHEWEGPGGVLSMAADNQAAGKKGPIVWQKPKMDHSREFMLRLMTTSVPLVIVCMRAKYPMEEAIVNGRKDWQRSKDLAPKQSEDILFEMFVHGWISRDDHAFHGTKYTLDELRPIFRDGEPISVETGKRLAAWAAGVKPEPSRLLIDFSSALDEADSAEAVRATVAKMRERADDFSDEEAATLNAKAKRLLAQFKTRDAATEAGATA
jgi:hypothetical protein